MKPNKKPWLQNLNWEKICRKKSACLEKEKTLAQKMPLSTEWTNMRPDVELNQEKMNHPIREIENLVTRNGVHVDRAEKMREKQRPSKLRGRTEPLFQRLEENNYMYRLIKHRI